MTDASAHASATSRRRSMPGRARRSHGRRRRSAAPEWPHVVLRALNDTCSDRGTAVGSCRLTELATRRTSCLPPKHVVAPRVRVGLAGRGRKQVHQGVIFVEKTSVRLLVFPEFASTKNETKFPSLVDRPS